MKITIEAENLAELKELLGQLTEQIPSSRNCHVNALPLGTRTRNCLLAERIETLERLSQMSEAELLRVPNLGKLAVAEIRGVLYARGHNLQ